MMTTDERELPCLYLMWPGRLPGEAPALEVVEGYVLRAYAGGDDGALRRLLESEGWGVSDEEWREYKDRILPGGLFVVADASGEVVGTAGAVHNPNPGRYYFPFGGELGYLVVRPEHRGRGLGRALSAAVVRRFLSAGYESVRVCVQGYRLAAVRTYLRLGFVPLLHAEELYERWRRVCERAGWPFEPEGWPKSPADAGAQRGGGK